MQNSIAIVGMACEYPDAQTPIELWENALSQRRAFRRVPENRLSADYRSTDKNAPDKTYVTDMAVIDGYEFDRVKYRVAGSTFRSADLAHWLALDVAARALADAGFPDGHGLPHEMTGVVIGNSLNGEFSRSGQMRLRWPFVQRILTEALQREGWEPAQQMEFLHQLEATYKAPFPPIGEESLAGSLANTIAGRVCNYFDFKGGGYTVDGACASSLLATATACSHLVAGDLDVAIAGGVDLSLDPLELVGFAKTGALASDDMRVFDLHSDGFWPGEGCGMVVLMRHEDAIAQGKRIYALIRGWGISSDGSGGITRPEVDGQVLAFKRAYQRAGFGVASVGYFEAHGTGTAVGDATELQTISRARRDGGATIPAVIGSMKGNIGHTKAAAGVAGLIRATMALHSQILPPNSGTFDLHPELSHENAVLRVLAKGELWPADLPLRAGVSAMGFGGINTHLVLEAATTTRRTHLRTREQNLLASAQDAELFLLGDKDAAGLLNQIDHLLSFAGYISRAQLADCAAELGRVLRPGAIVRTAVIANTPLELVERLTLLKSWLKAGESQKFNLASGLFLGSGVQTIGLRPPRIGFLFPGQGAPANLSGGWWRRRFANVQSLYDSANLPSDSEGTHTAIAQPAIATATLAGLRLLAELDIEADVAVGHSLGELCAWHWAGVFDEATLLHVATIRGQVMGHLGQDNGTMASLAMPPTDVQVMLNGSPITIACFNGPRQTVIAGEQEAIQAIIEKATAQGIKATALTVSHAFHSPMVAEAAPALAQQLADVPFAPLQKTVVSTITGRPLTTADALPQLLYRQITDPVQFTAALTTATEKVDLWIEVGPGRSLNGMTQATTDVPVVSLDAGGNSLKGLWQAVAAAFVMGAPVNTAAVFNGRCLKRFDLHWQGQFFTNPCELPSTESISAPQLTAEPAKLNVRTVYLDPRHTPAQPTAPVADSSAATVSTPPPSALDIMRRLVAERAELPLTAVKDNDLLLSDLHLNSIVVGQLVAETARLMETTPPTSLTDFANVTVADAAEAIRQKAEQGSDTSVPTAPFPGAENWVRCFTSEWVEQALPAIAPAKGQGQWQIFAPDDLPLAQTLKTALASVAVQGVAVCLPTAVDESHLSLLLTAAKAALSQSSIQRFLLVQEGQSAAAFARTLHLELRRIAVAVVTVPPNHPQAAGWVAAEASHGQPYSEAKYNEQGQRFELRWQLWPLAETLPTTNDAFQLTPADVLLVTGGGKGITAECALTLAQQSGCQLALLGRSLPAQDAELQANLARMTAVGLRWHYEAVDVTDQASVATAVAHIQAQLGPVTAILHGAARNVPQLLTHLNESTFRQTFAPKLDGLDHLLHALDPAQLRLLVTFGSVIARTGMPGEADYGLANEWLAQKTAQFQQEHPACRCLCVEWSVWEGAGMGAKLGRLEALIQQGITPIPVNEGVEILQCLIAQPHSPTALVVTGRFGESPTFQITRPELPFWRFLEDPNLFYPGVELVVEALLSGDNDPYLADHVFRGERLFLAVLGMEAMAQVGAALHNTTVKPTLADVTLLRPIVVPDGRSVRIRLAGVRRPNGDVVVALRSEETAFQVDHFRAICRFEPAAPLPRLFTPRPFPRLALEPKQALYGGVFFHSGRFMRVEGYNWLMARECVAQISPTPDASSGGGSWFGRYLPQTLLLGDPGVRDATIHAIQVCIPHGFLLPVGVERIVFGKNSTGQRFLHARERSQTGDEFIYDLEVLDEAGEVVEQWHGLRLRMVAGIPVASGWPALLVGPYLTRKLEEHGTAVSLALESGAYANRQERSNLALQRALGGEFVILRRPDGAPHVAGDARHISASHQGDLTLALASVEPAACDVEEVEPRATAVWQDLLGPERFTLAQFTAQESQEALDTAATRIWCASECLRKLNTAVIHTPLTWLKSEPDGWAFFQAGDIQVATWTAEIQGRQRPLVWAIAQKGAKPA